MNRTEAAQILAILKAAYPNSYKGMTKEEAAGTVAVWAMQFADVSADVVMMAVNKAISTSPFPPAISEVRAKFSAIHWEAYELLQCRFCEAPLPEPQRQNIQRIYDETRSFEYYAEPRLNDMLASTNQFLLGKSE